ncbi:hypothetical protein M885DRAFT_504835 [Pelagophyceae sp. CCMP2097]|nr:hypothetical protein M885DRAFT_504835 [Pelagophyceae sp. CCMP2097]
MGRVELLAAASRRAPVLDTPAASPGARARPLAPDLRLLAPDFFGLELKMAPLADVLGADWYEDALAQRLARATFYKWPTTLAPFDDGGDSDSDGELYADLPAPTKRRNRSFPGDANNIGGPGGLAYQDASRRMSFGPGIATLTTTIESCAASARAGEGETPRKEEPWPEEQPEEPRPEISRPASPAEDRPRSPQRPPGKNNGSPRSRDAFRRAHLRLPAVHLRLNTVMC